MNNLLRQFNFTVSVIMPVFNGAKTLSSAVSSVLNQTFTNFELIICNDASNDSTCTILDAIHDTRVRIIHNNTNIGPGLSRDKAIDIARGKWLAFIDADDEWISSRLETMLRYVKPDEAVVLFDDIIECHDAPSGMVPWRVLRGAKAFGGNGIEPVNIPVKEYVCLSRLLIKPLLPLDLVRRYQIRHSNLGFFEDTEFILRLLAKGLQLRYIPKPMYRYRITPGSATSLKHRNALVLNVLENSIEQFSHAPEVQAALRWKIVIAKRDEQQYIPFIWRLKKRKFKDAFNLVVEHPWIIHEFFRRIIKSLPYHIHRIWHGGHVREIR